ncbi:hypothetical protein C4565_05565 [Candidatus Parcubacteria bacterium]|nr:MAG: hypothetical protein C4565_05565 [Candidatus Parcubacteria bacterium]
MNSIYYCSENFDNSNISPHYIKVEEKLSQFIRSRGYQIFKITKPEIYKHPISFRFLQNFSQKSIHLVIRRPENIRILKNAFNILILPITVSPSEMIDKQEYPFQKYQRMFSLVDEILTTRKENISVLIEKVKTAVQFFKDDQSLFEYIILQANNSKA